MTPTARTTSDPKPARLNLRVSAATDELIRQAAVVSGQSVTEYVTDAAVQRARQVLGDQKHFTVDEESWDEFMAALDAPPRFNQRLANLFGLPSLAEE